MSECTAIKKNTPERYTLWFKHSGWAVIFLDEDGGFLSIQSDWGDYAYRWSHHGRESLKHFLIELDKNHDYLAKKLAMGNASLSRHFCLDGTIKALKKDIVRRRRSSDLTAQCARTAWSEITAIQRDASDSYVSFFEEFRSQRSLSLLYDDLSSVPVSIGVHPMVFTFLKIVWPPFCNFLKLELLVEGSNATKDDL